MLVEKQGACEKRVCWKERLAGLFPAAFYLLALFGGWVYVETRFEYELGTQSVIFSPTEIAFNDTLTALLLGVITSIAIILLVWTFEKAGVD